MAWKAADERLKSIPRGEFKPSKDLIIEIYRIANQSFRSGQWIPQALSAGILPDASGRWKKWPTLGRSPLWKPLTEQQLQNIRANPDLDGFIRLPWPFSFAHRHRGLTIYGVPSQVEIYSLPDKPMPNLAQGLDKIRFGILAR